MSQPTRSCGGVMATRYDDTRGAAARNDYARANGLLALRDV